MAEALVGPTVKVLLEKLLSLATDNISLVFGFKKDVETLKGSAAMIQAFIADAEEKQLQQHAVKLWLKKVEDVAYEADNVYDELSYEMLRHKVCFSSSSNTNIAFHWRMGRKIRDINIKLRKINKEANSFGLQSQLGVAAANTINTGLITHRETDSIVERNVVGRDQDVSMIVEKLLSPSSEVVSFIPIIGMGGLGKTTLARLVYNDKQIEMHFDKRIWVCVSDDFEVTRLFKLILESLTGNKAEVTSRDAIVQKIKKELEGKRYILVLDDVWEDNPQRWSDFLRSLAGISTTQGNWSIVTTRKLQVTPNLQTCHLLSLEKLSDHDCWSIVKEKGLLNEEVPAETEAIRVKVATICQGLPLVASIIGGLLLTKPRDQWLSIVDKGILNMRGDENDVLQILKLSFDHLPSPSIKKCFAYCSLFSKDTEIDKKRLIQLWMAEGFLHPNLDAMLMEEIGDDYFSILVQSSLLQEVKSKWNGKISGIMHDLVHDLAKSVSKSEMINLKDGVRDENCRAHYFVARPFQVTILKEGLSSLRTLFLENSAFDGRLLNFKYLRTLNLSGTAKEKLLVSVDKLIHLRYLDFSNSTMRTLPESVCKLYHLQTLRLNGCFLKEFPEGISNLISLRHLHYDKEKGTTIMPIINMGKLSCLQTLEFFNVSQEKGRRIGELGSLRNLRGELEIHNLELVNGKEDAEGANLVGKSNLSKLVLEWGENREGDNHDEEVLEFLQPHPYLQELTIRNYMGTKLPLWLRMNMVVYNDQRFGLSTRVLDKLVKLCLSKCRRCTEIPTLGHLPFLEYLEFWRLNNITRIGPSFYGIRGTEDCNASGSGSGQCSHKIIFPSLNRLVLSEMPNLIEWKGPDEETLSTGGSTGEKEVIQQEQGGLLLFPKLEKLTINNCRKLTTAPSHFPSLKELEIKEIDKLLLETNICSKLLTSLERLNIRDTGGFKCVPNVVISNNTNLLSLELSSCPDLTHLEGCSASLQRLEIKYCGNLRELPEDLFKYFSLEVLDIQKCPNLESIRIPIPRNISLQVVCIRDCKGLVSVRGGECEHELGAESSSSSSSSCSNLESLKVYNCPNLESFAVDILHAPSLSSLELYSCPKLMTLPKLSISSLRVLTIGPFSEEFNDWSGLSSLSSLSALHFYGRPHLESPLPHQLQYLTSLTQLSLHDWGIEFLPDWFGNFVSLKYIILMSFEKLQYLPSLAAMRHLTKLDYLGIFDCPLLKERCNPTPSSSSNTNSEWSKISHIPLISTESEMIRRMSIGTFLELQSSRDMSFLSVLYLDGGQHSYSPLPHQLQQLSSLTTLELCDFGIKALPDWFGNFASLQKLWLCNCKMLQHLPSKAAIRRLTKLDSFEIYNCPLLKERCTPSNSSSTNSEWSKISHIPHIHIV